MRRTELTLLSVEGLRSVYSGSSLGNSMIMVDELATLPLPEMPQRMHCVLLALCLKGEAHYSVNTESYSVGANDCIIIHDGAVVSDCSAGPGFSGIGVLLTTDFLNDVVKEIHEVSSLFLFTRQHPVFKMTPGEVASVREYFAALKLKVDDIDHHYRAHVVRLLLATMIYDLSNAAYRFKQLTDRKKTRAEDIFTRFISLVEANYREERRVGWYAQAMCLSPKYLSDAVRSISGRSPNKWIDYYLLVEIRVLLKETALSVKEIAGRLNYPSQAAFSRFFRKNVGMTPIKYRQSG